MLEKGSEKANPLRLPKNKELTLALQKAVRVGKAECEHDKFLIMTASAKSIGVNFDQFKLQKESR
jgi:hypothetical protein